MYLGNELDVDPSILKILEKHRPLNLLDSISVTKPVVHGSCDTRKNFNFAPHDNYSNLYKLLMFQAGLYLALDSSTYLHREEICKLDRISNFRFLSNSRWPVIYPKSRFENLENGNNQTFVGFNANIETPEIFDLEDVNLDYPPYVGGNIHYSHLLVSDFKEYEEDCQIITRCHRKNKINFSGYYLGEHELKKMLNFDNFIIISAFKVERVKGFKALAHFSYRMQFGKSYLYLSIVPEILIIYAALQMVKTLLRALQYGKEIYLSEIEEFKFEKIIYTPTSLLFSLQRLDNLPKYIKASVKVLANNEEVASGILIFKKPEPEAVEWHHKIANRILEKVQRLNAYHEEEIMLALIEKLSNKMCFVKSDDDINIIKEIVLDNFPHLKQ